MLDGTDCFSAKVQIGLLESYVFQNMLNTEQLFIILVSLGGDIYNHINGDASLLPFSSRDEATIKVFVRPSVGRSVFGW